VAGVQDLIETGQSIWLDNITRDLLDDGTIAGFIERLGVTGLTSNPSIFDKAISGSSSYDQAIKSHAAEGRDPEETFFALAIDDLRRAADLFAPVAGSTDGIDGWVSLEVSPTLADDTAATVEAARRLHGEADRPNLFIKIPGTPAGLPAIEEAIFAGVPVNVTLLFSTEQYLAAADAYLRGLERRREAGLDLGVASVASLFISRWDVALADQLPDELRNTIGVAVGASSYAAYRDLVASDRVVSLVAGGAPIQRLLFASTGTKDPAAPDTLYVSSLAAPDTVNTMPDGTLLAVADHGETPGPLSADGLAAGAILERASSHGADLDALAERLQREGAAAFVAAWESMLGSIAEKAAG
jgi:transaldolase